MRTLHVIYDPYCGWCYAAAPLIEAARGIEGLTIQLHGGGMMAGNNRQQVTPQLRDFVMTHIERIEKLSGQLFGEGYRALLNDNTAWLDSTPPTMAIVAAERWGRGLDMLHRMQLVHFQDGQRIDQPRVLVELAMGLGLEKDEFLAAFATEMERPGSHIRESRELLGRVGGQGFPTFALQQDDNFSVLGYANFFGKPEDWRIMLMHSP